MRYVRSWVMTVVVLTAAGGVLGAQETRVTVRVVANDAKLIGSGVGGAHVVIRNAATGAVLAEGTQTGGTGNTDALLIAPRVRGVSIYDRPNAAHFTATVAIDAPTIVEIVAVGPVAFEHAAQRAVKTMLLVPGEHVEGDGVVLRLHGFIVELLESAASNGAVRVRARVRMLCGCEFSPGGLWDADRLTVEARIYHDGRLMRSAALRYADDSSFSGTVSLDGVPDGVRLAVFATDAERVNFGMSEEIRLQISDF